MNNKALLFEAVAEQFQKAANPLIVTHEFTDGDDLGAALVIAEAVGTFGKEPMVLARGGVPNNLLFLPGAFSVLDTPSANYDVVVMLGCGSLARHGFTDWDLSQATIVNIDHHPDNQLYGQVNLVDGQAAANCELVYHLLQHMRVSFTKNMAINLLAGIFSDTGGFRHANTTAAVLEIAAHLMRKGARIDRIAEHYFKAGNLARLRAWAKALENARFDAEKKMVYSVVTEEELAALGATAEDLDGVVSVLNTVPEAKYSMLLKQRGDEIKGSLRSEEYKGVDVSAIARAYGGGGHKLAAGFKFKGKIERTKEGWKIF